MTGKERDESPRPHPCPRDLPGRSLLACPACSSGSCGGAAAPAPEPAAKFRRCKRENRQLSRTPPPPPAPHPRSPTPDGGDLGHPGRSGGREEGLPPGSPGAGRGGLPLGRRPQGRCAPSAPSPRAPLRAPPLPARGAPHLPRRAGAGLGQGAGVTSGCDAPLRPAGPALSGGFFISRPNSRCLRLLSLWSPRPAPSFSLVSRLFFPG